MGEGYISGIPTFILSRELKVAPGQPMTWSAVVTGTRIEDAGITDSDGLSIDSVRGGWPIRTVETEIGCAATADILIREK